MDFKDKLMTLAERVGRHNDRLDEERRWSKELTQKALNNK